MIRILATLLAATVGLGATGVQAKESYRVLSVASDGSSFLDAASVKRTADGAIATVLWVGLAEGANPGKPVPLGRLEEVVVSCDWRTVTPLRGTLFSADRKDLVFGPSDDPPAFAEKRWLPLFWELCGQPYEDGDAYTFSAALKAAVKYASDKPGAPSMFAPPPLPAPSAPGFSTRPGRFGLIASSSASGNRLYVDWSRLKRKGTNATISGLVILPPAGRDSHGQVAPVAVDLDCGEWTIVTTGRATGWRGDGVVDDKPFSMLKFDSSGLPVSTALRNAVCAGGPEGDTVATIADAVAQAKAAWAAP